MSDPLLKIVKGFLENHLVSDDPIILGLSGGPDSLALYSLLLDCKLSLPLDLHIAHIDHGWRQESSIEAKILEKEASKQGLPFHLHVLTPPSQLNNLEEKARTERLKFFREVYDRIGAQGLFLAHHFDDQSETVLKRVLEGSSLFSLGAMQGESQLEGMKVLRPLLSVKKTEISLWLETRGLKPFIDCTNEDTRFLRARLRKEILPDLSRSFGKEIKENLFRLGNDAFELKQYLERKISPLLTQVQEGPFGSYLDFTPFFPLERIELKAAIKTLFAKEQVILSNDSIECLMDGIEKKSANQKMVFKNCLALLDRGILFLIKNIPPVFSLPGPIIEGRYIQDGWEWEFKFENKPNVRSSSWRDLWKGEACVAMDPGEYEFIPSKQSLAYPGSSPIKDWWVEHKVPAFLRSVLPLICYKGNVVHEFFSGKKLLKGSFKTCLQIKIKRILNLSANQ